MQINEAFNELGSLIIAMGEHPLSKHENCLEIKIDERWTVAVNGHSESRKWGDIDVPAFSCYVEFNGWPAGIISPQDGVIAAGSEANEDAFIAVIIKKREEVENEKLG